MIRLSLIALAALAGAAPALAQTRTVTVPPAPPGLSAADAEIWPFPPPDPNSWWDEKWPKAPEAADPLGGRRLARGERLTAIDNGIDPSLYRLWGLMPLQWQVIRGNETILEVWARPSGGVRQAVVRVIVRGGEAFLQARAGEACCEAGIRRRIGFDVQLPDGSARVFQPLRAHQMWASPREVNVVEPGGDTAEALCVNGVDYDVTVLVPGRAISLHRACDDREIGEIADVLEPVLRAALGHDARFDVLFSRGVDFGGARKAYQDLIASGGRLAADKNSRPQAPGFDPPPQLAPLAPTPAG